MDETTHYYEFPDGSLREVTTTEENPAPPEGATELTAEEYAQKRQAIEQAQAQQQADIEAQEEAGRREDYEALLAAGVPEATARRLSGYTGDTGSIVAGEG